MLGNARPGSHLPLGGAILLAGFLTCAEVHGGSDTHYQDLIVGERAAGMGWAFTVLADEATGAYYNPAGIIAEHSTLIKVGPDLVGRVWEIWKPNE